MKNSNKFSAAERAAMEQSPADETHIRHNFMADSDFIDKITPEVDVDGRREPTGAVPATAITPETPEIVGVGEENVHQAAGGNIIDGVFTKKHVDLLKNIDQECSVNELIDLRSSLIKANKMLKTGK